MRREREVHRVFWTCSKPPGAELCTVSREGGGWVLRGAIGRGPGKGAGAIAYRVEVDAGWRTRGARVEQILEGRHRLLVVGYEGGRWTVGQEERPDLRGCRDVDLEATPVTNTLPLKRTRLRVGSRADVRAAWVRFPGLEVAPLDQSYERLGRRLYRYRSSTGYTAEIEVDGFGLVVRYGPWVAG
jgi:uncharacterized protein